MSLLQANAATAGTRELRHEINALKDQLARLSEASINISEIPNAEAALREVAFSA